MGLVNEKRDGCGVVWVWMSSFESKVLLESSDGSVFFFPVGLEEEDSGEEEESPDKWSRHGFQVEGEIEITNDSFTKEDTFYFLSQY